MSALRILCTALFVLAWMASGCAPGTARPLGTTAVDGPGVGPAVTDRCGDGQCSATENCSNCPRDCRLSEARPCPRVGAMYSVWHAPAASLMQRLQAAGQPALTVQQVIDSQASAAAAPLQLADVWNTRGLANQAMQFYYQHTPAAGFYCIARRRPPGALHAGLGQKNGDPNAMPDCSGTAALLRQHATQLLAAGIDFVAVDMTNIAFYSRAGDQLQLRPLEVLLQTWAEMRAAGQHTPDVAAWQRLPTTAVPTASEDPQAFADLVLDLYREPAYEGLWLRSAPSGKKLFFYPTAAAPHPSRLVAVASNGKAHDVLPVAMWTEQTADGTWSFMERCRSYLTPQNTEPTATACLQDSTKASPVGSQLAVSPSYQAGYASFPGGAIGHFRGDVLRAQFLTALSRQPDWLLLSSWNEHIAQPAAAPVPSMGLEGDLSQAGRAFVDTYAVEFSRDLEPTVEEGDLLLRILTSCLSLYRAGARRCDDPAAPCCGAGGFADFTFYGTAPARFGLLRRAAASPDATRPLFACTAAGDVGLVTDGDCSSLPAGAPQAAATAQAIGFVGSSSTRETLRPLSGCTSANRATYSLTASCPAGLPQQRLLGYVR